PALVRACPLGRRVLASLTDGAHAAVRIVPPARVGAAASRPEIWMTEWPPSDKQPPPDANEGLRRRSLRRSRPSHRRRHLAASGRCPRRPPYRLARSAWRSSRRGGPDACFGLMPGY